jgi:hypothetical protein
MQSRNTFLALAAASFLGASSFTQAAPPQPSNKYDGSYFVTQVEIATFGCQNDATDLPINDGDPAPEDLAGFISNSYSHHVAEQRSSISQRSAIFTAESSGGVLFIPPVVLNQVEIRMDGTADNSVRDPDEPFELTIAPDGSILPPPGAEELTSFGGQFSADGALFQVLLTGVFDEGECQDSFSIQLLGTSKDLKGNQ